MKNNISLLAVLVMCFASFSFANDEAEALVPIAVEKYERGEVVRAFDDLMNVLESEDEEIVKDVAEWKKLGSKMTDVTIGGVKMLGNGKATQQTLRFLRQRVVGFIGRALGGSALVVTINTKIVPDAELREYSTEVMRIR